MKTLYLHLGTPKTATTTLQRFCAENRAALNAHGYDFPQLPFSYRHTNPWRNGHFLLGYNEDTDKATPTETLLARRDEGYALLEETFERFDGVVLSDEALWTDTIKNSTFFWDRLVAHAREHGYRLRAVVYLRRQDQFVESMYNQLIKQGSRTEEFDKWIKSPLNVKRLEYYDNLERIAGYIGRDAVCVRVFDRAALDAAGGIQRDFLNAIGLEPDDSFLVRTDTENSLPLSPNALAIKRVVNMSPDYERDLDDAFRQAAHCCTDRSQAPRQSLLSPEAARALLAQHEEANDKIATEYLHRPGPLFSADLTTAETWTPGNPYLYDDVVIFFQSLNDLQTRLIEDGTGLNDRISETTRQERTWSDYYAGVVTRKRNIDVNVARCLGQFFVLRQRDIATGKPVSVLSDADVANLASILRDMSRKTASLQAQADKASSAPPQAGAPAATQAPQQPASTPAPAPGKSPADKATSPIRRIARAIRAR